MVNGEGLGVVVASISRPPHHRRNEVCAAEYFVHQTTHAVNFGVVEMNPYGAVGGE